MATTSDTSGRRGKAVVACTGCSAVLAAEVREDGSLAPLGTEDECVCGSSEFRRLR